MTFVIFIRAKTVYQFSCTDIKGEGAVNAGTDMP
jgi:hypothetical protein